MSPWTGSESEYIPDRGRIHLLHRKLERTPTHKIKFVHELDRLDLDRYV